MSRSTRDSEKRVHEMRETYDMEYVSPLSLPPGVKKEGYSYRYVNISSEGEENYRVEEMMARGWTPVPVDRAAKFAVDPLGRNPMSKKYICYKDVVLMERPEIYCKKSREAFDKMNANKIKSLRGVSNDMGSFDTRAAPINSF